MRFLANKDDLLNGIRIVERATVVKGLQPVLANVLIETVGSNQIKLTATDFDLSITTLINATIEAEGKFTLPAKKLGEIISRLNDELIKVELNGSTATITSKKSKFDIIGISANEFPQVEENISENDCMEIETEPFTKAIKQVVSAAAGYETNNLLSGVVCQVNKNILEMAATDGNRLARVREVVKNTSTDEENPFEMLISSRILAELSKIAALVESDNIKICKEQKKIVKGSRPLYNCIHKYNQKDDHKLVKGESHMTNTEYAKAHYDLNKLKSMKAGDVQVTIFPDEVKKGSIIDNPINGKKFFVKKPPVEEEDGALCCTCVEIKNGKK